MPLACDNLKYKRNINLERVPADFKACSAIDLFTFPLLSKRNHGDDKEKRRRWQDSLPG